MGKPVTINTLFRRVQAARATFHAAKEHLSETRRQYAEWPQELAAIRRWDAAGSRIMRARAALTKAFNATQEAQNNP